MTSSMSRSPISMVEGRSVTGSWSATSGSTEYQIASHCDYWDFVGALVDHKQYIGVAVERTAA
jgi:hypothetical protein